MNDQFDKKLINRINEVFENFEDDSAAEGWQELRKIFPGKQKKRPGVWWFGSAAAILLLVSIFLFFQQQNGKENNDVEVAGKPVLRKTDHINETTEKKSKSDSRANTHPESTETIFDKPTKKANSSTYLAKKVNPEIRTRVAPDNHQADEPSPLASNDLESEQELTIVALSPQPLKKDFATDSETSAEKIVGSSPGLIHSSPEAVGQNEVSSPEIAIQKQLLTSIRPVEDEKQDQPANKKKISLAFVAGSYFNYAEGSETSMHTGVGVSSEVKLSRKVKLSTGLSLGQNSLKFSQSIPNQAISNFGRTGNSSRGNKLDEFYNRPESASLLGNSSPNAINSSINSYNARLLGFDIPVNLTYSILEKKNIVYFSAGFSSNFFISESYTYDYKYKSTQLESSQQPDQETTSRFQSFDFARLLNLSVGLEYPLNKKTKISFEPFLKYPLSGLGSHDLRFGAAGMNLKFNFNR